MPVALINVDEFLDVLARSQLLKEAVLQRINEQVPTLNDGELGAERLARSLVKSQIITLYQAQRLIAGMAEGFYLGKYKLLDLLGRGGMGKVYLAEQITMNRVVALKVVSRFGKNRSDTISRFAREARAVAAISHPNIIQAFDFDELDGLPFISMEYVEGIDTAEQVEKFGPLGWDQSADYGMQAALGLEAARKAGFVHRDVKPGNLLVDRDGNLKLLDLGLAVGNEEHGRDSLTTEFDRIGTVDYMAPEQALDSHNVDIRADIYSLGCVLYSLITGNLPCPGKSTAEKLLKHQQTSPTPIQEVVPDIPEELAKLIHQMMEKKREARPQTPAEVSEALRPFAHRKSPPYPLSAIKHSREAIAPLLGRSPEFGDINIRGQLSDVKSPLRGGSGAGSKTASDSNGSQANGSASHAPTMINSTGTASTITGLALPPNRSGTKPVASAAPTPGAKSAPSSRVKKKPLTSTNVANSEQPLEDDNDWASLLALLNRRMKKTAQTLLSQQHRRKLIIGISLAVLFVGIVTWLM